MSDRRINCRCLKCGGFAVLTIVGPSRVKRSGCWCKEVVINVDTLSISKPRTS